MSVIIGKFVFNWFFACKINKSPCIIFVTFDFRSSTRTCIVSAFSYKIIHINSEYNVKDKDQNQLLNALKCSQDYLLSQQISSNHSDCKSNWMGVFILLLLQSQFKHTIVVSAVSAPKEFEEIRNARVFYLIICIFFDCSPNRCNCIQAQKSFLAFHYFSWPKWQYVST